eukprot:TRINITY_DN89916_c0_g1_i1.p2 TRINITY_DN89916_c0_g1~~TRINITY_DN89916_c0_g1_i1.p2  ORF type:complete len:154 (-),score=6.81 TRINITY_DN89916_c0_g1_i1:65-526(-)
MKISCLFLLPFLFLFVFAELVNQGVMLTESTSLNELASSNQVRTDIFAGSTFTIDLPSSPSAGSTWVLQPTYDPRYITCYEENNTGRQIFLDSMYGQIIPGRQHFIFKAEQEGMAELDFTLTQQQSSTVTKTYTVIIRIKSCTKTYNWRSNPQ